ncbi:MAG: hypothetical protein U1D55_04980 [Phycisphaerae bacterium]
MKRPASIAGVLLAMWTALLGVAQTPPATQPPNEGLAALRAKETLSDDDRAAIRGWVQKRADEIAGDDRNLSDPAVETLRAELKGTAAFREAIASALVEAARAALKSGKPSAAPRLITAVNAVGELPAQPLLLEALRDERASVRMVAAAGLRELRAKVATAGGNTFSDTVSALRDAAKRETSAPVLRALYAAMNFPEVAQTLPDARTLAAAALDAFEARAELHTGKELRAEGAELVGLKLMAAVRPSLTDPEKEKYVIALTKVLRHAVIRWTSELHAVRDRAGGDVQAQLRNQTEQMIEEGEAQLAAALGGKPPADISSDMRRAEITNTKIEFNKWAEQVQKTYNVDLKIQIETGHGSGN